MMEEGEACGLQMNREGAIGSKNNNNKLLVILVSTPPLHNHAMCRRHYLFLNIFSTLIMSNNLINRSSKRKINKQLPVTIVLTHGFFYYMREGDII